ncbi:putative HMW1C, glycosyltransferase involved in glycosylation of HMW1A and HMW2A [Paraburkholderia piptadeniae]|uniref:HMW1C, glycosyltransferase involved in glycosylation of HMW1A and HMW2A n=1 Tax=Paraburkholderia piptadeniae TaxID=1701573 RepID=A0A1N7SIA3_9BURK|nr:peptide transporter [Paraburkholderia piptadeniae]SIT47132.1 putative HMW1C, glycosyltransferase involved in glycosylation of HMW1A and HMW2A [Paraburkholderia piptadeniae]
MTFSINKFEYLCFRRDKEPASRELLKLLKLLDDNYGYLKGVDGWAQSGEARDILDDHLLSRLAAAITALVSDPSYRFSEEGFKRVQPFQRWLAGIFAASPFRNADHILRSFGCDEEARNSLQLRNEALRKFQLFYLPESEVRLDWDALWNLDKTAAAGLAMTILSSRFLATPSAHQKRELILRWLPDKLDQIESLDSLPTGVLHSMYMHCSYADLPGKHDIKKPINTLIRRKLASLGLQDVQRKAVPVMDGKPVVLVVLEWFSKNHSIYRTHSQTMVAMRDKFHLVGMGFEDRVDDSGREVFHEFIPFKGNALWENARQVREVSEERQAQMMYMPSVGMFPITMVLACLRVAPMQLMALGHPATTHGHAMDYVVVEEDYVGDEACFSEKLLKLPSDGMPYRPPAAMLELDLPSKRATKSGPVKIAVAGTTIKLNPRFLQTCADIANEASVPVEFHFLVGQATGVIYPQVCSLVRRMMGDKAVVHKHQNYANYMKVIAECDLFLNPFPFGNTNGIVDTVWAGLVGVCKTGREVHEHIDEGMFRRLGFPEWMIAKTNDEYKAAALRLIDNPAERRELAGQVAGPKAVEKLIFTGRPEILGERMQALWEERVRATRPSEPSTEEPAEALPLA